jgi:type VI secretion system protein ImpG
MNDGLLAAYQRELAALRQTGVAFAKRHPEMAGHLHLTADISPDPHVERLIEATALLAARVQARIDDGVPEITRSLLAATYPHLLQPVPCRAIAALSCGSDVTTGVTLARGTELQALPQPVGLGEGVACRFRTTSSVTLWPLHLRDIRLELLADTGLRELRHNGSLVLRCRLEAAEGVEDLAKLPLENLVFHLDGPPDQRHALLELLLSRLRGIVVSEGRGYKTIAEAGCEPVGFAESDGLLDYNERVPLASRYLLEYLSFPEKFLFVDVIGLKGALKGKSTELCFVLDPGEVPATSLAMLASNATDCLRLGCVPVVNQFSHRLEPVRLSPQTTHYPLVADSWRPQAFEVHAVQQVRLIVSGGRAVSQEMAPLFSARPLPDASNDGRRWHVTADQAGDGGLDLSLSLADPLGRSWNGEEAVLAVTALCGNRDLPARLTAGSLELVRDPSLARARLLRRPLRCLRPGSGDNAHWRLVSHLSFNRLSLSSGGVAALRGLLEVYNFAHPDRDAGLYREAAQRIGTLVDLATAPDWHTLGPPGQAAWCQGSRVDLTFDEADASGSKYLFALVLERFLALHASANSFVRVTAHSRQRQERIATWVPRAGLRPLI